ncbi:unnamed protein product [Haemonchus placei]|uniref:Uncharacterized protein n=1 Tax=Haemonchus placei TaxID=6290 RepID=A0A0N4XAN3_HAEPC|nr:unnamed protein product [Haemonchus placei]
MVCLCCRCCVCCKCGRRGVSDGSGDDRYEKPGAKHIPVPVYGKSQLKRIKQTRSSSHEASSSSSKSVITTKRERRERPVSAMSMWNVPLDVDVVPLNTKPVTVSESLPWIDDSSQDEYDCSRQKRKPGFRPLRGSSAPASGTPPEHSSVRGDSTRRQRKHKKMEKKSGGGFFQVVSIE